MNMCYSKEHERAGPWWKVAFSVLVCFSLGMLIFTEYGSSLSTEDADFIRMVSGLVLFGSVIGLWLVYVQNQLSDTSFMLREILPDSVAKSVIVKRVHTLAFELNEAHIQETREQNSEKGVSKETLAKKKQAEERFRRFTNFFQSHTNLRIPDKNYKRIMLWTEEFS